MLERWGDFSHLWTEKYTFYCVNLGDPDSLRAVLLVRSVAVGFECILGLGISGRVSKSKHARLDVHCSGAS